MIFFLNQYFFSAHQDDFSPSFFVLPKFTNPSADSVPSKPLIVYQRRKNSVPLRPPPATSLNADPVPATAPEPLRHSTRVHRPPDRYGFTSPLSLTATLSSIPIPSSYKQAMEHECWRKAVESELLALEEN